MAHALLWRQCRMGLSRGTLVSTSAPSVRTHLVALLLVLSTGCASQIKTYPVDYRGKKGAAEVARDSSTAWYASEDRYIATRRKAAGIAEEPKRGENLKGIALSGGGIRSATFSLGVLQALARTNQLGRYDYVSGTSGGAYTTAWLLAHYTTDTHWLQQQKGITIDGKRALGKNGWEVRSASLGDLLLGDASANCGTRQCDDQVLALQSHSGFLKQGTMVEALGWLGEYAWRLPFSLLFDVALHTKSDWNWYHLIAVYSDRIGDTYLAGIRDVPLTAINRAGLDAPYGIFNANLLNDTWHNAVSSDGAGSNPFEFTAQTSGADSIGYIASEALDELPTGNVSRDGHGSVVSVELRSRCSAPPATGGGSRADRDGPLRLRDAVAASGAAFDPDGVLARVDNYPVRQTASFVAAPLNFNLGLETWNYASDDFGGVGTLPGYGKMQTSERLFNPSLDARWIKVTDGGHFENTSVFSLLRRGVTDILAVDAGADGQTKYGDRKVLAEVVRKRLHLVPADPGEWFAARTRLYFEDRANLPDEKPFAVITWIKPSRCFCATASAELSRIAVKACDRVHEEKAFPHTSTIQQWYTIDQFEAYRALGYAEALQVTGGTPVAVCP